MGISVVVASVMFSNAMFSGLIDPLSTSDFTFHSNSGVVASRLLRRAGFLVVVVEVVDVLKIEIVS